MRARTLLLTLVASFCDASTFVGAGRLFSAHVTGNFIVLAEYRLLRVEGWLARRWCCWSIFGIFVPTNLSLYDP
jgi:uncharacterized membrane protein YoaK (UPF0700 family)